MQTVLYVYESQNNNGWKWCAVQTDERIGEVQRLAREKESLRINSKPAAVSIGVSATARLGIDLDRVEFRRPPAWTKPAATYPTEPGAPLTWQEAQKRVDAGLGVETLRAESLPGAGWRSMADYADGPHPSAFKDWTYRVPAEPCLSVADKTIDRLAHELASEKQAHAETKLSLAAARGLVKGLENDLDNWYTEAKRLREEKRALKLALGSFGL